MAIPVLILGIINFKTHKLEIPGGQLPPCPFTEVGEDVPNDLSV